MYFYIFDLGTFLNGSMLQVTLNFDVVKSCSNSILKCPQDHYVLSTFNFTFWDVLGISMFVTSIQFKFVNGPPNSILKCPYNFDAWQFRFWSCLWISMIDMSFKIKRWSVLISSCFLEWPFNSFLKYQLDFNVWNDIWNQISVSPLDFDCWVVL